MADAAGDVVEIVQDESRARGRAVAALFAAATGALVFAVTLGGTYVFDDVYHLWMDERIASAGSWWRYLTESYNDGIDNLYRPVTSLSWAVQAWMIGRGEEHAWTYHAVNLLLYAIVCAQVTLLGAKLWEDVPGNVPARGDVRIVGLACGVLFAVHPVHAEAVASLVGRADLICAIGFLGALLLILRPLTPWRIAAFVALMLLSIGGKEQGLVLPAVAGVWYLAWRRAGLPSLTGPFVRARRIDADDRPGFDAALSYERRGRGATSSYGLGQPFFVAVAFPFAAYVILREQVLKLGFAWPTNQLDPTIQPMIHAAGLDRWLMPVALAGRYLRLLIWPSTLSLDYGTGVIGPPQRLDDAYLWLGVLAILLCTAAVVHAWRTRWTAGLTMLAGFAFTYAVVSNIPRLIGTVFGERLIFLPSAFFIVYMVLLAMRLTAARRRLRPALAGAAMLLALLGALRSISYAAHWQDRVELYSYQTQVQPRSVRAWMLLAEELRQVAVRHREENNRAAADAALLRAANAGERATHLAPDYWDNWVVRARIAVDQGRLEEAYALAERAVAAPLLTNPAGPIGYRDQIYFMIQRRDAGEGPTTGPASQPSAR